MKKNILLAVLLTSFTLNNGMVPPPAPPPPPLIPGGPGKPAVPPAPIPPKVGVENLKDNLVILADSLEGLVESLKKAPAGPKPIGGGPRPIVTGKAWSLAELQGIVLGEIGEKKITKMDDVVKVFTANEVKISNANKGAVLGMLTGAGVIDSFSKKSLLDSFVVSEAPASEGKPPSPITGGATKLTPAERSALVAKIQDIIGEEKDFGSAIDLLQGKITIPAANAVSGSKIVESVLIEAGVNKPTLATAAKAKNLVEVVKSVPSTPRPGGDAGPVGGGDGGKPAPTGKFKGKKMNEVVQMLTAEGTTFGSLDEAVNTIVTEGYSFPPTAMMQEMEKKQLRKFVKPK